MTVLDVGELDAIAQAELEELAEPVGRDHTVCVCDAGRQLADLRGQLSLLLLVELLLLVLLEHPLRLPTSRLSVKRAFT